MRTSALALTAATAVLLPATAFSVSTDSASAAPQLQVSNCSETRHGTTVRIKLRVEDRLMRVRVSHPRGTGNFHNRQVQRVVLIASQSGPTSRTRGIRYGDAPVYRLRHANAVDVKFVLRNGRHMWLSCMYPATFPPCPTPAPGEGGVVC